MISSEVNESKEETSSTEIRTERMEERGRLSDYSPQDFHLVFENKPVWLLALNSSFTKDIYCTKCKTLLDLLSLCADNKIEKSLYQEAILILGSQRFRFSPPLTHVTTLISGSITFLNEKYLIFGKKKAIYITDEHVVLRRKIPQGLMTLTRIKHVTLGGATNFEGLYAYSGTEASPKLSSLRRQVGDFIDYGIPPSIVLPPDQFIRHKVLMPVTKLHSLVQYPTHFSLNGVGYRPLKPFELAKLFGVSTIVYQMPFSGAMFPIVSVQILDALLLEVLHTSHKFETQRSHFTLPPIHTSSGSTLLPNLGLRLKDSWSKVVAPTDIVATNDLADINQAIWDQRVTLVFPKITVTLLNWFRKQILRKHFSTVFKSFKRDLQNRYPVLWENYMSERKYLKHFNRGGRWKNKLEF